MKKLPVPENIPLRWELYPGFGLGETIRTSVTTGVVLVICLIIGAISGSENAAVVTVAAVIVTLFLCAAFFGRIDQSQSIYEYLNRYKRFNSEQQLFRYKQKDEVILFVQQEKD